MRKSCEIDTIFTSDRLQATVDIAKNMAKNSLVMLNICLFVCIFMFFSLYSSGVAGFALQRCSQCQRLHPGVRHLLRGEL